MEPTDRCWCGHQVRWHTSNTFTKPGFGLCKYCVTRNLKYSKNVGEPQHEISDRVPEWMHREAAEKFGELMAQGPVKDKKEEYKFTVGHVEMITTGSVLAKYLLDYNDTT